jgi:hypothetical protein
MTLKRRIEALERSLTEFEARASRTPLKVLVVNDPEMGLEEYRLPQAFDPRATIEIGRPDPGGDVENAAAWVAKMTGRMSRA